MAIEVWYEWSHRPSFASRSNFTPYGLETNFVPDQMEQILQQKLGLLPSPAPDFVQVGDSSGFFGIMPEVIERYLPGMKYLNASCCGTQGYHGYLAMLRYQLRRFPSIRYIIVHSGFIGVPPGPQQWRNAPNALDLGGATLKTLGAKMETELNPPWSLFSLPTNSLRQAALQKTFLNDDMIDSVNTPRGIWETIVTGLAYRQGFGLEADVQNTGNHGSDAPRCWTLKYETYFDWLSMRRKSYLDAFVEEFVSLAREFGVTPILVFQIASCRDPETDDVRKIRENLRQLQTRFPDLRIPFDIIDEYPQNLFSVMVHVQRDVAEEISHRLGRALRAIVRKEDRISPETAHPAAALAIKRATRVDTCRQETDISEAFQAQCNGHEACDVDLSRWRGSENACLATFIAEFNCTGGPVRILRQESEQRFGGRFRLDCRFHDRWSRDEIPYGIRVADARFGGQGGSPMGLVTLRAKAFCDGLMACDYLIKPPDGSAQTGDFSARWYCGSKEKTLRQQDAKSETRVQLVCP